MANAWRREVKPSIPLRAILLLLLLLAISFLVFYLGSSSPPPISAVHPLLLHKATTIPFPTAIPPFDCESSPQATPVIANLVEGLHRPFLYSLADMGSLPGKPHKNIVRFLKGKPFRRPHISATIQNLLQRYPTDAGIVVDVGANVGMSTFAASSLGFRVLAFEPVLENLQRLCEGVYFNRASDRVVLFAAAASDRRGNITFHKLVGRLDNSAVSAVGARLAFKSKEEVEIQVASIPLDDVVPESENVLLIKIDVQGWEYHVLKGATKLLSRKGSAAPYLIYEEDERLLQASNSTSQQIREFLKSMGYNNCTRQDNDAHCVKN